MSSEAKLKKIIEGIIFVLLLVQATFTKIQNVQLKDDKLVLLSELEKQFKKNNLFKKSIISIYSNSCYVEQKNFGSTNFLKISNSIKDGKKIFCYIEGHMCHSCILRVLQDLSVLEKRVGNKNIILLINKEMNKKSLNLEAYNFQIIKTDYLRLPEKEFVSPLIFILDEKLTIKIPYITEWYPELYEEYFTRIIPSHFH